MAALSTAIRLQAAGFAVIVYEQGEKAGGKMGILESSGYYFDTGPSLFTMPWLVDELLTIDNNSGPSTFDFIPINPICKYFWEDGLCFSAAANRQQFIQECSTVLNEKQSRLELFLKKTGFLYHITAPVFLESSLHLLKTYINKTGRKGIANLWRINMFDSMNKVLQKYFSNPKTVQLFSRYATYNGSNPYQAPATLNVISYLEIQQGAFYPRQGMYSIAQSLYEKALDLGVEFHFLSKVEKIIRLGNTVQGVQLHSGKIVQSKIVISNCDAKKTYQYLLGKKIPRKIRNAEPSSSALIFYWGIKKEFKELGLHNILFSNNYEKEFECLFKSKDIFSDPTVYINISSKYTPEHAPAGCENWFVMINVPANVGQNWPKFKEQARKFVVAKINTVLKTDIEAYIETENVLDPIEIENKTGSSHGSLYGSSSNNRMSAFFRQANFSKKYKGLYFCGGSVHPGGGIPLALLSGKITSEIIINRNNKIEKAHS